MGLKNQPLESKAQLGHQEGWLGPGDPTHPTPGIRRPSAAAKALDPFPSSR